jgi:hypothetical protein
MLEHTTVTKKIKLNFGESKPISQVERFGDLSDGICNRRAHGFLAKFYRQ